MKPAGSEDEKTVDGRVMLLVTVVLVSIILALAVLAGPFGREQTIGQQASPH
jgi:hypothetical protein